MHGIQTLFCGHGRAFRGGVWGLESCRVLAKYVSRWIAMGGMLTKQPNGKPSFALVFDGMPRIPSFISSPIPTCRDGGKGKKGKKGKKGGKGGRGGKGARGQDPGVAGGCGGRRGGMDPMDPMEESGGATVRSSSWWPGWVRRSLPAPGVRRRDLVWAGGLGWAMWGKFQQRLTRGGGGSLRFTSWHGHPS